MLNSVFQKARDIAVRTDFSNRTHRRNSQVDNDSDPFHLYRHFFHLSDHTLLKTGMLGHW